MFDLLGTMEVGGVGVDVNRSLRSVQYYVQRFRLAVEQSAQFSMERAGKWTRVWRVA